MTHALGSTFHPIDGARWDEAKLFSSLLTADEQHNARPWHPKHKDDPVLTKEHPFMTGLTRLECLLQNA